MNLEEMPKSKARLKEYATELLGALQKELTKDAPVGSEVPEIGDELTDYFIGNIISNNKRALYDLFDKEGIHLLVDYADGYYWQIKYKIGEITTVKITEPPVKYEDRISCENEGFDNCFKIFENE